MLFYGVCINSNVNRCKEMLRNTGDQLYRNETFQSNAVLLVQLSYVVVQVKVSEKIIALLALTIFYFIGEGKFFCLSQ